MSKAAFGGIEPEGADEAGNGAALRNQGIELLHGAETPGQAGHGSGIGLGARRSDRHQHDQRGRGRPAQRAQQQRKHQQRPDEADPDRREERAAITGDSRRRHARYPEENA